MSTHSRVFPCMSSQVTAGKTKCEHLKDLPLSHQLQPWLSRLFSHTRAHPSLQRQKPPSHPIHLCLVYMGWTVLQVIMVAQLQDKLTTMDLQALHLGEIQGTHGSKASARTTTRTPTAPKPAPALLRQTAAFRIRPQRRNNVRQMCQVYHLPCREMLLF